MSANTLSANHSDIVLANGSRVSSSAALHTTRFSPNIFAPCSQRVTAAPAAGGETDSFVMVVVPEKMKNASTGQPGGRLVKPSGLVKSEKMGKNGKKW
ncbi:MAG: hypothetical protein LBE84_08390 [Planctomycetota bacterium]|jgi:hypothetical protein|nr:hypothetical protein [Planctomycetota bacterium]